ncbi:TetR/AcrR family transcriptional regulator [Rhodococcus qingshengii]|uniref:TetR/AcrR family transcriptional regulator n=1 Tax=Rhodococcus qingshengii TaxID=334542 RepID=UPI001AE58882|nr:TetR/AcrR family transcriptional regulator [Rhodococcus qingshengii]MBP1048843.1 TetR/AcrR family transcriptional regulator [Rhodococcus qingshengii]MDJ0430320.1 TetR/AcrR family transcriptional regulator [Rhodococcus qingshengii]
MSDVSEDADETGTSGSRSTRARNPRGSGTRLRGEIVAAAATLIARTGSDQAVTLRSVAREVGISAPSIYGHFSDRDAIVEAVVSESLEQLHLAVADAVSAHPDPVEGLYAGCSAYVEFGISEPARYRVLFGWSRPKGQSPQSDTRGLAAFNTLVNNLDACVAAGRSASTDTFVDAVSIWTSLHGQVMLRADLPEFPWPSTDTVGEMVRSLARLVN